DRLRSGHAAEHREDGPGDLGVAAATTPRPACADPYRAALRPAHVRDLSRAAWRIGSGPCPWRWIGESRSANSARNDAHRARPCKGESRTSDRTWRRELDSGRNA